MYNDWDNPKNKQPLSDTVLLLVVCALTYFILHASDCVSGQVMEMVR